MDFPSVSPTTMKGVTMYAVVKSLVKDRLICRVLTISSAAGLAAAVALPLGAHAQTNCAPAPSGLVSWWRAEGSASDSADSNNGVLQGGATFAQGEVGQAFSFNGTDSSIQVADAPNLRFTTAMTVEAWIYPRAVGGAYHEIISKWEGGGSSYILVID